MHTRCLACFPAADLYHLTMRYCEMRGDPRPAHAPPTLFSFLRSELGLAEPQTGGAPERDMALDAADMDAATLDELLAQSGGWTPLDAAAADGAGGGTSSPPPANEATQVDNDVSDMQVDRRDVSAAAPAHVAHAATQLDAADDATQLDAPPPDPGATQVDAGTAYVDPGATQIDALPPS